MGDLAEGFSDFRITNRASYERHVQHIYDNPVKASYARSAEEYPYCSAYFRRLKGEKGEDVRFSLGRDEATA